MRGDSIREKANPDLRKTIREIVEKITNGSVCIVKQDSVVIQINTSEIISPIKVNQAAEIGG